jgi:thioredoxin-like negative regulator of GroEL
MKPTWDQLGDEYAESKTVVIADVDCTVEKDLCSQYDVRGYPTIKYFTSSTAASGDKYEGGRDFKALKTFVDENLGPSCGAENPDLCNDEQKAVLDGFLAMSADERAAEVAAKSQQIADAEENFKTEVDKLQKRYQELSTEKEETIAEITPNLRLLRTIKDDAAGGKDEL